MIEITPPAPSFSRSRKRRWLPLRRSNTWTDGTDGSELCLVWPEVLFGSTSRIFRKENRLPNLYLLGFHVHFYGVSGWKDMAKMELVVEHRFFHNMRKSNWTISPKVLGKQDKHP